MTATATATATATDDLVDPVKVCKFRLRERCGVHTEDHPTDPELEVLVQAGQVFLAPEHRGRRWPEKFELMPDETRPSADLVVQGRNGRAVSRARIVAAGGGRATALPVPAAEVKGAAAKSNPDRVAAAAVLGTIEAMTADELKRFASDEGIDLGKAKGRDDLLKAVKAGLGL